MQYQHQYSQVDQKRRQNNDNDNESTYTEAREESQYEIDKVNNPQIEGRIQSYKFQSLPPRKKEQIRERQLRRNKTLKEYDANSAQDEQTSQFKARVEGLIQERLNLMTERIYEITRQSKPFKDIVKAQFPLSTLFKTPSNHS